MASSARYPASRSRSLTGIGPASRSVTAVPVRRCPAELRSRYVTSLAAFGAAASHVGLPRGSRCGHVDTVADREDRLPSAAQQSIATLSQLAISLHHPPAPPPQILPTPPPPGPAFP